MRRAAAASLMLVALFAAACGDSTPPGGAGPSDATSSAPTSVKSQPATSGGAVPGSGEPSGSPTSGQSSAPTPAATDAAGPSGSNAPSDSASPSASAGTGPADACTGSDGNRAFYANLAASVSWDVYCAVLPKGWVVSSGSYRLANGGKLVISYRGPDGSTLALSEGAFCTDGTGCVPSGSDAGSASFGSMAGTLVTTDAGGFAIVAARGEQPSWLLVTSGLDQETTTSLGAALALVR